MKPYLPIIIVLLLVSTSFVGISHKVEKSSTNSSDSNILYVGGSGPGNYTKIQDAINDASEGDTVFVYNGTYVENVVVDKSINLFGEKRNNTIVDGNENGYVVHVCSDWVNISGFTIKNCSYSCSGVYIPFTSNSNKISDNNISNNDYGIILSYSNSNTITNNIISNNEEGIHIHGDKNTISGNIISNNEDGIFVFSSQNNNISGNALMGNVFGIALSWSILNKINHNNFINNCRNAIFVCFSLYNKWEGNYWGRPRPLLKPIFGNVGFLLPLFGIIGGVIGTLAPYLLTIFFIVALLWIYTPSWVNFDWHPAREPYDIEV